MTVAARLVWIVVVLTLVGGAAAVVVTAQARDAAAEELESVTKRSEALEKESREQPGTINRLREDRKDRVELAKECLVVIVLQSRSLNRLIGGLRTNVSSRSELEEYADKARDLQIGFRQLLDECEGT